MFRTDNASSVGSIPTPAAPGTPGYFTNGNPATGAPPTIADADWFNRFQEEMMTLVTSTGLTPSKTSYNQVAQAIISGVLTSAADTSGAANTITAALIVPPATLNDGLVVTITVANNNTGATVMNLNGFGNKAVTLRGNPLVGGELKAAIKYTLSFDLPSNSWQLDSPTGQLSTIYTGSGNSAGTANVQTVNVTPAGYSRVYGNIINFTAGVTNTGAMTINIQSTGAVSIKKYSGSALIDLASGDVTNTNSYSLFDNGTYYVLQGTPLPTFGNIATLNAGPDVGTDGNGNIVGIHKALAQSGSHTIAAADRGQIVYASANNPTITLNPTLVPDGHYFYLGAFNGQIVTLSMASGVLYTDTGSVSSYTFKAAASNGFSTIKIQSDGTNSRIIDGTPTGLNIAKALPGGLSVTSTTTSNTQATLTAGKIVLSDANGNTIKKTGSLSVSYNASGTGANGIDTGALGASTWYYEYFIYNPTTDTLAALLSLSATAPTLPAGYTYSLCIGEVLTDSNSHLIGKKQVGRRCQYMVGQNCANPPVMKSGVFGNVNGPTYVAVAVAGFVPPTAVEIDVLLNGLISNSLCVIFSPNNSYGAETGAATDPALCLSQGYTNPAVMAVQGSFVLESSNVYYASSGSATYLRCIGWRTNLI